MCDISNCPQKVYKSIWPTENSSLVDFLPVPPHTQLQIFCRPASQTLVMVFLMHDLWYVIYFSLPIMIRFRNGPILFQRMLDVNATHKDTELFSSELYVDVSKQFCGQFLAPHQYRQCWNIYIACFFSRINFFRHWTIGAMLIFHIKITKKKASKSFTRVSINFTQVSAVFFTLSQLCFKI